MEDQNNPAPVNEETNAATNVPPEQPSPPAETVPPVQPSVPAETAPPPKRGHMWLYLVGLVVLLVAAGALAYLHFHKSTKANTGANTGPKAVQNLNVGIQDGDFSNVLYPQMGNTAGAVLANAQIFEGLVAYQNQNQIVPELASGWTNPDDNTWLFTLKSGIKFHDGHSLAPGDVVYSLNLLKGETTDYAQSFANTIKDVQAVGSNQVKITTTQPDPAFLNKLTFCYIIDQNLPKGAEPSQAGTGAYTVKAGTTPNHLRVDLTAFNDYHGGTVWTKAVSLQSVKDVDSLVSGFKNHSFDLAGEVPFQQAAQLQAKQYVENDTTVTYLAFNSTNGPLANKAVRQAIRYAVDPTTIGKAAGQKVTPINQLIPPSIPGYNPGIAQHSQNVAKAKQLLAQAGYANGLSLSLGTNYNSPEMPEIVNELKQVGITATLHYSPDFDSYLNDYLAGKGQVFFLAYSSDTLDGADILQTTLVPANYQNQSFYDLVSKAAATVDPASRLKQLQQASSQVDQDVPVVPLSYNDNIWVMNQPYVLHQDLPSEYTSVYFYKVHL